MTLPGLLEELSVERLGAGELTCQVVRLGQDIRYPFEVVGQRTRSFPGESPRLFQDGDPLLQTSGIPVVDPQVGHGDQCARMIRSWCRLPPLQDLFEQGDRA